MDLYFDKLFFYGKKMKELIDILWCNIVSMLLEMKANATLPMRSLAEVAEINQLYHCVACLHL